MYKEQSKNTIRMQVKKIKSNKQAFLRVQIVHKVNIENITSVKVKTAKLPQQPLPFQRL